MDEEYGVTLPENPRPALRRSESESEILPPWFVTYRTSDAEAETESGHKLTYDRASPS